MSVRNLEEEFIKNIVTLDSVPGRLRLQNESKYPTSPYFTTSAWRYATTGDALESYRNGIGLASTRIKTQNGYFGFLPTLAVEVGFSGSDVVWRGNFLPQKGRDISSIIEPAHLAPAIRELCESYGALRELHGLSNEPSDEVLLGLGQYLELRLPDLLTKSVFATTVEHVVPADNGLLTRQANRLPDKGWNRQYDRPSFSVDSRSSPLPTYFRQMTATSGDTSRDYQIVCRSTDNRGKVKVDTFLIPPTDPSGIAAIPESMAQMMSGSGEFGQRWTEAIERAVKGYKGFCSRVEEYTYTGLDRTLREQYGLNHFRDKSKVLDAFVTSYLQREVDGLTSGSQGGVPRVSMTSRVSDHRRREIERRALYAPSDFEIAPEFAEFICRGIDQDAASAHGRGESSQRNEEPQLTEEAAIDAFGPPPAYAENPTQDSNVGSSRLASVFECLNR